MPTKLTSGPFTIEVTADDWRAARRETQVLNRLQRKYEDSGWSDERIKAQINAKPDYSCICVMARAILRQIPSLAAIRPRRELYSNGVAVAPERALLHFKTGTQLGVNIDWVGRDIITDFDAGKRMPSALRQGVAVTLTPFRPQV